MSDNKNFDTKENKLKKADSKKSAGYDESSVGVTELLGGKKAREASDMAPVAIKTKKKLPLAVDIIVGIIMIALVIGVIAGAYMLFRYFSNDYEGVSVEYTVVFEGEDLTPYLSMKSKDVYIDTEDNTLYFGKITETKIAQRDGAEQMIMKIVCSDVRFKNGEGYTVSGKRLAVGSSFDLRCGEKTVSVTVTELKKVNKGGK